MATIWRVKLYKNKLHNWKRNREIMMVGLVSSGGFLLCSGGLYLFLGDERSPFPAIEIAFLVAGAVGLITFSIGYAIIYKKPQAYVPIKEFKSSSHARNIPFVSIIEE
jgi:hypothetical protein